jgi:opacity protein-like surface antigen
VDRDGRLRAASAAIGLVCTLVAVNAQAEEATDAPPPPPAEMDAVAARPAPPPRPPSLPALSTTPPPPTRHVDIGGGVALISRLAASSNDGVSYGTGVGFGLSARWSVVSFLRVNLYAARSVHDVHLPSHALGLPGDPTAPKLTSYSFGLRVAPTLTIGPRARAWVSAGVGWGRLEFGRFQVAQGGGSFTVRERAASFIEFPAGLGASFDVIPNWLAVELETTAALLTSQRGTALEKAQAIDVAGKRVDVGAMPGVAANFVTTLGVAIIL